MSFKPVPGSAPVGAIALDDLDTIESLVERYPHLLTVQTLRWQLRHRDENGLAAACVPVGKKLLISRSRYEAWLATRAGAAPAAARQAKRALVAA